MVHVIEMTQPQGHSTSGSHERYKSEERLQFEVDFDCIKLFREWIILNQFSTDDQLKEIEKTAKKFVSTSKNEAWRSYQQPILEEVKIAIGLIDQRQKYRARRALKQIDALRESVRQTSVPPDRI